jgi:hypothetical protein
VLYAGHGNVTAFIRRENKPTMRLPKADAKKICGDLVAKDLASGVLNKNKTGKI